MRFYDLLEMTNQCMMRILKIYQKFRIIACDPNIAKWKAVSLHIANNQLKKTSNAPNINE